MFTDKLVELIGPRVGSKRPYEHSAERSKKSTKLSQGIAQGIVAMPKSICSQNVTSDENASCHECIILHPDEEDIDLKTVLLFRFPNVIRKYGNLNVVLRSQDIALQKRKLASMVDMAAHQKTSELF